MADNQDEETNETADEAATENETNEGATNHSHEHTHANGTTHSHEHTHAAGVDHEDATHNHTHEGANMTVDQVHVDRKEWDAFQSFKNLFSGKPAVNIDAYNAIQKENAENKNRIEKMESEQAHQKDVFSLSTELKTDKFGKLFDSETFRMEAAEKFLTMPKETREWVMQRFAAFSGQIDYASKIIRKEIGSDSAANTDPIETFTALITEKQKEKGFEGAKNYSAALHAVRNANPDVAVEYDAVMKRRGKGKE